MLQNLKFLRVQSGMTLEQLAEATGFTRSYLSKVERGVSNPSIGAAVTIAQSLGIAVERLFGKDIADDPVRIVRSVNGNAGNTANYLSLLTGGNSTLMRAFVMRPAQKPGRGTIMSHHEGEEFLFVLSGKIELQLGSRREILNKGDCMHFDSTIPHKLKALTSEPASALVVIASSES